MMMPDNPAASDPATAERQRRARRTALVVALVALAIFALSIAQMLWWSHP